MRNAITPAPRVSYKCIYTGKYDMVRSSPSGNMINTVCTVGIPVLNVLFLSMSRAKIIYNLWSRVYYYSSLPRKHHKRYVHSFYAVITVFLMCYYVCVKYEVSTYQKKIAIFQLISILLIIKMFVKKGTKYRYIVRLAIPGISMLKYVQYAERNIRSTAQYQSSKLLDLYRLRTSHKQT